MTIRKLEAADWLEWRRMRCALWPHHTAAHEAEMKTWLARPDATLRSVCAAVWCWAEPDRAPEKREAVEYHLRRLRKRSRVA